MCACNARYWRRWHLRLVFCPEVTDHGLSVRQLDTAFVAWRRLYAELTHVDIVEQVLTLRRPMPDVALLVESGVVNWAKVLVTGRLLRVMCSE